MTGAGRAPVLDLAQFLSILIATALANNIILVQLLGVSSLFAYSTRMQQAVELSLFSFLIMVPAALINALIDRFLLTPLSLQLLRLLCFVLVSASLTALLAGQIKKHLPLTWRRLDVGLLLVGGNSAVIGLALTQAEHGGGFQQLLAYSLGAGLGFVVLLLGFAALRQRLDHSDMPLPFRGAAIQLISAGIVAMSLLGFGGAG